MPTRVSRSKTCEAAALALLLVALVAPDARAQPPKRPAWKDARCPRVSHASAAFVGRVLGFERVTLPVNWGLGGGEETLRLVHLAVEEGFKGVAGKKRLGVLTWLPERRPRQSACARDFEAGGRYLVYAYSWARQPELRAYVCEGGAVPLAEAADDLAYLRAFVRGEPVAEVAGRVEQYRREYPANSARLVRALEGVEVTAEGFGRSLKTKTDAEGLYHFVGLRPGTYNLHIDVPEGLYTLGFKSAAFTGDTPCYQSDFQLESDGRVAGRATDAAGRPAPCAMVSIVGMSGGKAVSGGLSEMRVGEGGRFILGGFEGYAYAVRAYVPVIDGRGRNVGRVVAEPAVVNPAEKTPPLRIRIPPEGDCDFMTREKP